MNLLQSTGLSVGEIARRVGLSASQMLSRMIHAEYGVTPRQLRQAANEGLADLVQPREEIRIPAEFSLRPRPAANAR